MRRLILSPDRGPACPYTAVSEPDDWSAGERSLFAAIVRTHEQPVPEWRRRAPAQQQRVGRVAVWARTGGAL